MIARTFIKRMQASSVELSPADRTFLLQNKRRISVLPALCQRCEVRGQQLGHSHRQLYTRVPRRLRQRQLELRRRHAGVLRRWTSPPDGSWHRVVRAGAMRQCGIRLAEARRWNVKCRKGGGRYEFALDVYICGIPKRVYRFDDGDEDYITGPGNARSEVTRI